MKIKNIFVTGSIKIGKSTIVNKVAEQLGVEKIGGFKTIPIFENGIRKGFALESYSGQKQIFAHTNLKSNIEFDVYRYDVSVFENFGSTLLETALEYSDLILLDEIGVMEKQTTKFRKMLLKCLDSSKPVLGTFQQRADWFSDILNARTDTKIFSINESNREKIDREILLFF